MKGPTVLAVVAMLVAICAGTSSGVAQTVQLTPPMAIELPTIDRPADAPPQTHTIEVELLLTIDATGAVTKADVVRSAGPLFDAAVVAGVRRFTFQPATRDGIPIAVRIPFVQKFEPPPPPLAETQPDLDAVLVGMVVTRGTRKPIAGATIAVYELPIVEPSQPFVSTSDEKGYFLLPVRSAVPLQVRITATAHDTFVQNETVARNQRLSVKYLVDQNSLGQYESYVHSDTDRSEVSRTTLSGREITKIPGTFGDPFRVISLLPGTSTVAGLLPLPIVRGSSPGNTGLLLDGVRLPLLYHLLAGPSVIHPELIDRVDFYPGGFPVSYGGYTGGIVDGITRAARADERRVDVDLNLTQTGGLVREPIASLGLTATAAARIGYPGLLLSLLSPDVSLSYWDYQARVDGGQGRHRWSLFAYGAADDLKNRMAPDQPLRTVAHFEFHRIDLRYRHGDDDAYETYRLIFGNDNSQLGGGQTTAVTGNGALGGGTWSVEPRIRVHRALGTHMDLNLGLESNLRTLKNPDNAPTQASPLAMDVGRIFNQDGLFSTSGLYVELVYKPTERLRLIPGLRGDLYDERHSSSHVTQTSLDPRLLARYRLVDHRLGGLWLKGVVGRYHQPPRIFVPVPGLDSSSLDLGLLASTQYSVGIETQVSSLELDTSVYFNDMDPILFDLIVTPAVADIAQAQPANPAWQLPPPSTGRQSPALNRLFTPRTGRSYGLELLLRRRDTDRLFGWVSYTLSRSERQQPQGWEPFDFDRHHILNLVTGIRLPRNWEFGTRVLYQTGTPLSTIFGRNITRSQDQFRVDLRIDKRAVWNRWLLDFYVDIINTTVAQESGGLVGGNAIRYLVPTLGFRGVL